MRDDDVPILVSLLRHDAILDDRNRRAFACSKADGNNREANLTGAPRLGQHLVGIVESFAVTHQNDRFVALRSIEREQVRGLAQSARWRAAALPHYRWIQILQI